MARQLPKERILRCSVAEYHAGPRAKPSLSASVAHAIVAQSPLHGYPMHPTLGAKPNNTRKATDEGTVLRTLMLRKGAELSVFKVKDFRTAEVREERDTAIAAGRIVLKESDFERGMAVMRCAVVEECERCPALLVRARETTYDRCQAESRRAA